MDLLASAIKVSLVSNLCNKKSLRKVKLTVVTELGTNVRADWKGHARPVTGYTMAADSPYTSGTGHRSWHITLNTYLAHDIQYSNPLIFSGGNKTLSGGVICPSVHCG